MSKEAIIRDLPESFVLQMRNWVKTRSSVGVVKISPAYEGMPGNPKFGPRILADFTEVSMLERAIDSMKPREGAAVKLFWIYEGNDIVWMCRRLAIADMRTFENRVSNGHNQVRSYLATHEHAYERSLERTAMAIGA